MYKALMLVAIIGFGMNANHAAVAETAKISPEIGKDFDAEEFLRATTKLGDAIRFVGKLPPSMVRDFHFFVTKKLSVVEGELKRLPPSTAAGWESGREADLLRIQVAAHLLLKATEERLERQRRIAGSPTKKI